MEALQVAILLLKRWKTQINENSKSKAFVGYMPEIHHNEILSWDADKVDREAIFQVIFLRDDEETRTNKEEV